MAVRVTLRAAVARVAVLGPSTSSSHAKGGSASAGVRSCSGVEHGQRSVCKRAGTQIPQRRSIPSNVTLGTESGRDAEEGRRATATVRYDYHSGRVQS